MNTVLQQMFHTWSTGGWVMAALALLAIILYATAANLLILLHHPGLTRVTDEGLGAWLANPSAAPDRIRDLIRYTQDEAQSLDQIEGRFRELHAAKIPEVDRRLVSLNIMVVAAPLFGLLGTVLGMLLTFKAISVGGSSTADIIARGVSEALVATQTGMMVAIPGLLMVYLAKSWRNEYAAFLARLEGRVIQNFRAGARPSLESIQSNESTQPTQFSQPIPA